MARRRVQPARGADRLRAEVAGMLLLVAAAVAGLALAQGPAAGGLIGTQLAAALRWVLGRAAWVLPPLMAWRGLAALLARPSQGSRTRQAGLALAVVLVAVLAARPCEPLWASACLRAGGGLVGTLAGWLLARAFGTEGALIAWLALAVLAFRLISGVPLAALATAAGRRLAGAGQRLRRWMVDVFYAPDEPAGGPAAGEAGGATGPAGAVIPAGVRVAGRRPGRRSRAEEGPGAVAGSDGSDPGGLMARLLQRAYLDGPAILHEVEPGAAGPGDGVQPGGPVSGAGGRDGLGGLGDDPALPAAARDDQGSGSHGAEGTDGVTGRGGAAGPGLPPRAGEGESRAGDGKATSFRLPPVELLSRGRQGPSARQQREVMEKAAVLQETLASFGVQARIADVSVGPAVTRFEVEPARGVKVSKIQALASDIALSLAVPDVRIEAPIPGKAAVGIEVPNREIVAVQLRDVLETPEFARSRSKLTVALGKDIAGQPVVTSLDKLVHVLIAGATGSGKSVCINALIASLLFKARPDEVKLLLVDPKVVELSAYNGIPHLIAPVITDARKAAGALQWAVREMERRYELFARTGVRDVTRYNLRAQQEGEEPLPLIVVVIDELADLMMVAPVEVEDAIQRLAQMARASGMHLVVATQRPSVDVITGVIKANIPSRIAFAVSSQTDSRVILDLAGAEKLVGKGDMLFMPVGATKPLRVQGAYISEKDLDAVLRFLRDQAQPEYDQEVVRAEVETAEGPGDADDDLFTEAVRVVLEAGQASVSLIQRRLRVGYTRAGRLIDMMEERGYIGPHQGAKPRDVLITWEEFRRRHGDAAGAAGGGAPPAGA